MNRDQAIVLGVAVCNIIVILLFPPYDSVSLARGGGQSFDAFYPMFSSHPGRLVNFNLLLLELYWVLANGALAWLLLRGEPSSEPVLSRRSGVILIAVLNLALVWLFPPFENYASTLRSAGSHFDGFYFLFGDKWQRRFYIPLLYMEVVWVLINAAVFWLLLRPRPAARPG
jgi:hypothetical protein